jgi:S-methylmethionine-dependent homocysteine/selenocysteine methylase
VSYRDRLPQLIPGERLFITDGGLETVLIFQQGIDLPEFAAFDLLKDDAGFGAIRAYYEPYLAIAREYITGFVLEAPTWRANPDWASRLGYSSDALETANRKAIALMEEVRTANEPEVNPIVISACIGPQGDAYAPEAFMSADEAERYHGEQIATFSETAADMVSALTITYADEAVGIVRAAVAAATPVAISFTVETDGRLPSGQPLRKAIEQVDAQTRGAAAYFMVNCAHPTHFAHVLEEDGPWLDRLGGVRANASTRSHAELDEAEELDDGDPVDLGARYRELHERLPSLRVVGGCCGTDDRHVAEVCAALHGR